MAFEMGSSSMKNLAMDEKKKIENKLKALIVDDDAIIRKIMSNQLRILNVESLVATNGKEAVELHKDGATFNIIFMDNDMPIMDGVKATQILRSMGVQTKIIGVSAKSMDKEKQEFIAAGLDEFYAKPMKREMLNSIIKDLQKNF